MSTDRIETVEELDAADYGPYRGGGDEPGPDETTCRNCGHLAIEHADGATAYSVCPSALISAEREVERLRAGIGVLVVELAHNEFDGTLDLDGLRSLDVLRTLLAGDL